MLNRKGFLNYFYVFIGALLLSGCGSVFTSHKALEIVNEKVLLNRVYANASRLKTFQGMGQLIISAKGVGIRGTIKVKAKMPDSLWMKIEGPLGIDIATAIFYKRSAVVYSPFENKVWKGSFNTVMRKGYIPHAIDSTNFILSMVGLPVPPDSMIKQIDSLSMDKDCYLIVFKNKERMWIDRRGLVKKWEKRDNQSNLKWVWEGSRFIKKHGFLTPSFIRITSYNPKQQVTILYENVKTNKPVKRNFNNLDIPEGVKTVEL